MFLRFTVKLYGGSRVELAPNFVELERAREKFNFTHLPEDTELLAEGGVRLLLAPAATTPSPRCAGAWRRRRSRTSARRRGSSSSTSSRTSAGSPNSTTTPSSWCAGCCSNSTSPAAADLPAVDAFQAGVLLEVMKDLLYQAYVRRGRLQQAMMVRRYFAETPRTSRRCRGTRA